MEYIALQIYRSANFRQKRQIFQVASFVCVYARIHIGSADFEWRENNRESSVCCCFFLQGKLVVQYQGDPTEEFTHALAL